MTVDTRRLHPLAVSVLAVVVAAGVRALLDSAVGVTLPFAPFLGAVVVAAWHGGARPALVAAALGLVMHLAVFGRPVASVLAATGASETAASGLYLLLAAMIAGFSEALHRERRRASRAEEREREGRQLVETTERERRRADERLSSLLENTLLGVVEWDGDFRVLRWSGQAERIFGWRADEVVGRRIDEFPIRHEEDVPRVEKVMARLQDPRERFVLSHNRNRTKSGAVVHCEWYNSVDRDEQGRTEAILSLVLDVSERVRAEAALREADRRKDEFLATLAHELRNPLAPMRNALEIMRLAGRDSGAAERARSLIERQLAQMVRLIDDLLDVSRISLGKLELRRERVPLARVVASAVETSRPVIESARHELAVSLPREAVWLDADLTRLAQAIVNLLNNAARYMEPGGAIRLLAQREPDGRLAVRVRDSGVGIPPETLPQVFTMFGQGLSRRSDGGLGIGLALVRRLVELHGGTIEAHSEGLGRGAEFVIRLPVAAAPPAAVSPPRPAPEPRAVTPQRVLVVDDNCDAALSLATMLEMMGHETRTCHDGPSALELAATTRPAVVLLDIGMPGMSGYEVASRIRQSAWGGEMTLVALTGWGQEEDRRRSREAGFDEHLVKPVSPDVLRRVLAAVPAR
jgi:PAS domain S-box-containing protein